MSRATGIASVAALFVSTTCASAGAAGSNFQDLLNPHDQIYAYELLDRPDVRGLVRSALGTAYTRLERSLRTAPAIPILDDRFVVAHGCHPHDCAVAKATLILDTRTGTIRPALID